MQDRYLFAGAGGDQLTGRVLCGLPFNDAGFASLPPHFDGDLGRIPWPAVLPSYPRLPQTFKRALPNLLASICYHETWLRSTLSAHHPLFATYLFASGEVTRLKVWVVAGRNHCPLTGMQATGIPPHLVMSNELTDVARQTELMKEALLDKCKELPAVLASVMLNRFSINGAVPVTIDDIKTLLNSAVNQMRSELRDAIPSAAAPSAPLNPIVDIDATARRTGPHSTPHAAAASGCGLTSATARRATSESCRGPQPDRASATYLPVWLATGNNAVSGSRPGSTRSTSDEIDEAVGGDDERPGGYSSGGRRMTSSSPAEAAHQPHHEGASEEEEERHSLV